MNESRNPQSKMQDHANNMRSHLSHLAMEDPIVMDQRIEQAYQKSRPGERNSHKSIEFMTFAYAIVNH